MNEDVSGCVHVGFFSRLFPIAIRPSHTQAQDGRDILFQRPVKVKEDKSARGDFAGHVSGNSLYGKDSSRQKVANGRTRVLVCALPKSLLPKCTW